MCIQSSIFNTRRYPSGLPAWIITELEKPALKHCSHCASGWSDIVTQGNSSDSKGVRIASTVASPTPMNRWHPIRSGVIYSRFLRRTTSRAGRFPFRHSQYLKQSDKEFAHGTRQKWQQKAANPANAEERRTGRLYPLQAFMNLLCMQWL